MLNIELSKHLQDQNKDVKAASERERKKLDKVQTIVSNDRSSDWPES